MHRRADAATDLGFAVQENADLSSGFWTTSNGTVTLLSDDGVVQRIRFTSPSGTLGRKFLRVMVAQP